MNTIAAIIIITLLGDFILHIIADKRNLAILRSELPVEFESLYAADRYRQSQAYLKVNTRFGWLTSTFSLFLILIFWFGKGFPFMDQWARSAGLGPVWTGLIFIGILVLLKMVISLPFSIYATFVIENRFGFNRTTKGTFALDLIKTLALAILLGGPLLAGILAFFEYAGTHAWLYCWGAATGYMLVVQYVAPTWILPLFNKFDPIEEGPLKNAILSYARSIQFPLKNVYVMDGSKRSTKSNAFFTGFGKHRRIVLFDTLIKQHSIEELLGILAHEMGHYKKKHLLVMLILGIAEIGLMFFLLSFFISYTKLFEAFYMDQISVYAGMIFFGMLYSPIVFFLGLFTLMISRRNEYAADRFAIKTTGDSQSLAMALKKLSVDNLSNLLPHPLYVFLNYSHPPILERLKAIKEINI